MLDYLTAVSAVISAVGVIWLNWRHDRLVLWLNSKLNRLGNRPLDDENTR